MAMDEKRRRHPERDRKRSRSTSPRGDRDQYNGHKRSERGRHHFKDDPRKRRKKDKRRSGRSYDDDSDNFSESSSLSSASSMPSKGTRRRHRSKKRARKEKKKKDKKKRKKRSRQQGRSRSPSSSPPTAPPTAPPGAHELAASLTRLFNSYPDMPHSFPLLLVQLGQGTTYNLSQMPDQNRAGLLGAVFRALGIHGMELGSNGWRWINAASSGGRQKGDDLALLRLARALLNGVGITMDRVKRYEEEQIHALKRVQQQLAQSTEEKRVTSEVQAKGTTLHRVEESENLVRHKKRIERMTSQLLDRFDSKNSSSSASSLANELKGICDVMLQGESVQLEGIENGKLKATLTQLFQLVGLQLVEMEQEEEDGEERSIDDGHKEEKCMGYTLPPDDKDPAASYLSEVLRTCHFRSSGGAEGAPTSWAADPAKLAEKRHHQEESSSDEDTGPAPLGTMAAVQAAKRKRPPKVQTETGPSGTEEGGREEWMMVPGEHDFLKGIQAGGAKSFRGRTFKNERNHGQPIAAASHSSAPIRPEILEEVSAIREAYEQSRGPSLFDAHRKQQQETKQRQQGQAKEWKWSREGNLDEGRRVDKNALHTVLGGARTELKSKFHGSHGS